MRDADARAAYNDRLGRRINGHLRPGPGRAPVAPDITEVIDNAVRDYSVSGDAMRWTPEPLAPTRISGVWPLPRSVVVRVELEVEPFVVSMKRAGAAVWWIVLDETRLAQDAKRQRMRLLHTSYRAKRGKRW